MPSFRFLQEKPGLAKHILQQTAEFLPLTTQNVYNPLRCTHTGYRCLIGAEGQVAESHLSTGFVQGPHHASWDDMEHFSADTTGVAPMLYVQRRVLHTLSATCVWCTPAYLVASAQVCIQRNGPRSCCNSSRHAVAVWSDVGAGLDVTGLHPNLHHCWWWVGDAIIPSFLAAYPEAPVCTASVLCQGRSVHLFTSPSAVSDIDELQCFRLCLALSEYGTCFLPRLEKPRRTATCSALTRQMQFALDDKNLGKWALL